MALSQVVALLVAVFLLRRKMRSDSLRLGLLERPATQVPTLQSLRPSE
jgi:hypothetical protein